MAPGLRAEDVDDVGDNVFGLEEMVGVADAVVAVSVEEDMLPADGDEDIDAVIGADVDEGEDEDVVEVVSVYSVNRQRRFISSERCAMRPT